MQTGNGTVPFANRAAPADLLVNKTKTMPKRGPTGEPGCATKLEIVGIDATAFHENGVGLIFVLAMHQAPNTAVASAVTPNSTPGSGRKNKKARGAVSHATAVVPSSFYGVLSEALP